MESYLDLVPSSPRARTPSDVGIYYINQVKRHFKKRIGRIPRVKLTNDELEKYTRAFAALAELADKIDAHLPRLFALMERHLLDELVTIITTVSAQRQRALYSRRKRTYILTYADVVDYTTTLRSVSQRFSTVTERTPFANPDRILPRQLRSNVANSREPHNAVAGPSRLNDSSEDNLQPSSLANFATTRAADRLRRATIPGSSMHTPPTLSSTTSPLSNPTRRWSYDAAVHGTLKQGSSSKRPLETRSPSTPTFTFPSQKKMRRRTWPTSSAEDVSHDSTTELPKSKGKARIDPPPVPPKATDAWKPGMPADALRRRMKRRGTMDSLRAAFDEDEYILRSIPEPKFPVFPSPTPLLAQKRPGAPHTLAKPNIASKALWMISASESTDSLVPMVDANDTPEMPSPPPSPVSCVHRSDDDISVFDELYADRRSSRTSIPSTDPEVIGITDPYPKIADDGDWLEFNLPISGLAEKWVEKVPEPPRLEVSAEPTQIWWKMVLKTASSVFPTLPRHS